MGRFLCGDGRFCRKRRYTVTEKVGYVKVEVETGGRVFEFRIVRVSGGYSFVYARS